MRQRIDLPEADWLAFVRNNGVFLFGYLLLFIVGSIILWRVPTGDEILWLNAQRTPFLDVFLRNGTRMAEEEMYLVAGVFLLFVRFRTAIASQLLGISVLLVSGISKWFFAHDRPAVFFQKLNLLESLNVLEGYALNEGINSFPSGHTMSAFAVYSFIAFSLPQKRLINLVFLLLAAMVAISRIYLIQHFLKDVLFGSALGLMLGMLWYYLQYRLPIGRSANWMDLSLLNRKGNVPNTEDNLPPVQEEI